ncbi:MAG: hypothetical protein EOO48_04320 [Flavobacterium sp.]|nr:MAG: hypothetical protein EOO48_04320 [Flavobacterium sp.]
MKKLIAVLTLFLAFAFSANAQEGKKMSAEESAKMDATQLSQAVGLKGTQQDDFIRLFMMKYNMMNNPEATPEKKKEMARVVDAKIRASLTAEQIQILDSKPELMAKLTGSANAAATPKK